MKKKAFPIALVCLSACAAAHAVDCAKPPFGDSSKNYQQFVLNGEVASKGDLKVAQLMAIVERQELISACNAKFLNRGVQRYTRMGLSEADLRAHSVVQLAAYSMGWKSKQGDAAPNQADDSPLAISVEQFAIQGPKLALRGTKLLVSGAYIREGDTEYIYANSTAIEMEMVPGSSMHEARIALLTNDASDNARTRFLTCGEDPAASQIGCSITVEGTATTCVQTSAFGATRNLPCLDVQDIRSSN